MVGGNELAACVPDTPHRRGGEDEGVFVCLSHPLHNARTILEPSILFPVRGDG